MPRLMVVGDFGDKREEYIDLIDTLDIKEFVTIVGGYIPDKEVEQYFSASNLVALPYESATQSGIVQIAYGFRKPVIVTNVGGLPEVVEDYGWEAQDAILKEDNYDGVIIMLLEYYDGILY